MLIFARIMEHQLKIYNTLTKSTTLFKPIAEPHVGIYLCGPTVYGEPHLGHVRGPVVFDILHRYLRHLGYKVRLVRNITDVGHLTNDSDDGNDKIAQKAKLEKLEPMEIAQKYTYAYHRMLNALNVVPASIEPRATGHIIEQIEMIKTLISKGFAYEKNGSVYFNVQKYNQEHHYGVLSGRVLEELQSGMGSRTLEGSAEKRNPEDFALWKKADPSHIMQWPSPWGQGFPGWHIECSAMSAKYLGAEFDIHGGGMDLLFPHHECEIAQSTGCYGVSPARFWVHHNMITINGQKMAKSLNNGIMVKDLFSGNHVLLEKKYSAMNLRFFVLQAHYRGTLDFSNEALQAAGKGLKKLTDALTLVSQLKATDTHTQSPDLRNWVQQCYNALNEDLNTPMLIAHLFEAVKIINNVYAGKDSINPENLLVLQKNFPVFVTEILGLKPEETESSTSTGPTQDLIEFLLEMRKEAKANRDFAQADTIRNRMLQMGIEIKDTPQGTTYTLRK